MKAFGYAIGVILLLAASYIGSYYANVTQDWSKLIGVPRTPVFFPARTSIDLVPKYRIGGDAAVWFYSPWHVCDRRLRPESWSVLH